MDATWSVHRAIPPMPYRYRGYGFLARIYAMTYDTMLPRRGDLAPSWSGADSTDLYQIEAWGKGYFAVSDQGHVVVRPETDSDREIDLYKLVQSLHERDLHAPILIRFSDILAHRLRELHGAFQAAIDENGYRGRYTAVYPIKVNQQRPVVEEVFRYGQEFDFGLEVGSKPELLAVMAMTGESPERLIVCNGFKDESYVEAVVLAAKLGRPIIPVVEGFVELDRILRLSESHGVRPQIGIRAKLASHGSGRWSSSNGERSKFGLFADEILRVVETLREREMLDRLTLLHCHAGSQVQDILRLKEAVGELAHIYVELVTLGADLRFIDVGGGLGVDYDGSQTNSSSSINYGMHEYANEIVYRIGSVCDHRNIPHPTIISESGRAMAAYQSVLVFNALGRAGPRSPDDSELHVGDGASEDDVAQPLRDLRIALESVDELNLVECFHDVTQARADALALFALGYLTLEQRGLAERLFWATCERIWEAAREQGELPEELEGLAVVLGEVYFCNFSVFQSLPDTWAIDQLFPIMPIHRLLEAPTRKATLADLTCDSDGLIDRFVDVAHVRTTLDLHELEPDQRYYLAAFLVGAYQETLGDLHNLFGDTHVVHIRFHDDGGWWIDEIVPGDTAGEVLSYVQYDVERLCPALAHECELAVRRGDMSVAESRTLLKFYSSALNEYTYLSQ